MLSTTTVICMLEPLPTGPLSLQPSSPLFTFFFFPFFFWLRASRQKSPVYRSDVRVNIAKDFIKAF